MSMLVQPGDFCPNLECAPPTRKQPQPGWQYLQMLKHRDEHGHLINTELRVIFGQPEKVLALFGQSREAIHNYMSKYQIPLPWHRPTTSPPWTSTMRRRASALVQSYAATTLAQSGQVSITLSDEDLKAIQRKALDAGVPYQTLIADVVHRFVTRRLVERPSS